MRTISLSETGHSGSFAVNTLLQTVGTLRFRLSGPHRITVDELVLQPGVMMRRIAYQLLDALHQYAYEKDCTIHFQCPIAKAINDQQIAQELRELAVSRAAVA